MSGIVVIGLSLCLLFCYMYISDNIQVLFYAYTVFYLEWFRAFYKDWYSTHVETSRLFFSWLECSLSDIYPISFHFYIISETFTPALEFFPQTQKNTHHHLVGQFHVDEILAVRYQNLFQSVIMWNWKKISITEMTFSFGDIYH